MKTSSFLLGLAVIATACGCSTTDPYRIPSGVPRVQGKGLATLLTDSHPFPCKDGATILVCSRVYNNGMDCRLFFREVTFDGDGKVKCIGPEVTCKDVAEP